MAAMALKNSSEMPCTPIASRLAPSSAITPVDWTPGEWSGEESENSQDGDEIEGEESLITTYNEAMASLSEKTKIGKVSPLTFQLETGWDEATDVEKGKCIEKAMEGCKVVCEIIAPNAGDQLFRSCAQLSDRTNENPSGDLLALMQAYKNAPTGNLKTQILSLYAYRYPMERLQKLHEPFESITMWQIKRARAHAREYGPGFTLEKASSYRVRLDTALVDHFIEFVNRPYFYQDVSFGTRKLKLDNGEQVTMPNVIRTVTRSTMIQQYLQFCEEEEIKPLSRATLFRILEVREASQQKSLAGLDNTATDGSAGFEKIKQIVDDLDQIGQEEGWSEDIKKSLQNGKQYLKTKYREHCQRGENTCPDHCVKFALSDPNDEDLQEKCEHEHTFACSHCVELSVCLDKVEQAIKGEHTQFYSKEQQEDMLYDFQRSAKTVNHWKSHIMRSANQERAKQDILEDLDSSSNLIIMDWAMKFVQMRYREKQSDWFGKRGLSWHISSVISRDSSTGELQVTSYAHLFDQCTQDWFAVASIIEDLLTHVKMKQPGLKSFFLRSDEAGCYHSNFLIAAVRDIGQRVGVAVEAYDFSEPQSGKDVCDRILCPLKSSVRTYCSEGNDILSASDMRDALQKHPVRGTSASVNMVDESKKSLQVKKIDHFSGFHNFTFESSGISARRAYKIGRGKLFPYDTLYLKHQEATGLMTKDADKTFFEPIKERRLKTKKPKDVQLPSGTNAVTVTSHV